MGTNKLYLVSFGTWRTVPTFDMARRDVLVARTEPKGSTIKDRRDVVVNG